MGTDKDSNGYTPDNTTPSVPKDSERFAPVAGENKPLPPGKTPYKPPTEWSDPSVGIVQKNGKPTETFFSKGERLRRFKLAIEPTLKQLSLDIPEDIKKRDSKQLSMMMAIQFIRYADTMWTAMQNYDRLNTIMGLEATDKKKKGDLSEKQMEEELARAGQDLIEKMKQRGGNGIGSS